MRRRLMGAWANFWTDDRGATAIEYALLSALIAIAVAAATGLLSTGIDAGFTGLGDILVNATAL